MVRGGTFVLLYDDSGMVIADFMLSHYIEEIIEESSTEPPLVKPTIPKGEIDLGGILIRPSWDNYIGGRLDGFKLDLNTEWNVKFETQNSYVDVLKDTFQYFGSAAIQADGIGGGVVVGAGDLGGVGGGFSDSLPIENYTDGVLGINVIRAQKEIALINIVNEKLEDPGISAEEKVLLETERDKSQQNLSENMKDIVTHVDNKGSDVVANSESALAMQEVKVGMQFLQGNTGMMADSQAALANIRDTTSNAGLKESLGSILGF